MGAMGKEGFWRGSAAGLVLGVVVVGEGGKDVMGGFVLGHFMARSS